MAIFSALKGGSANRENERLLAEREEQNEAFRNLNSNYMETNAAKSVLEKAREQYQERAKIADSKAAVTGATAEQQVAEKSAANKDYNDVVRNVAAQGTAFTQQNDMNYQNNLSRLLAARMNINQQKADSAANAAGNAGELLSSAAMLEGFKKPESDNS